jgi:hypothetical protein
MVRILATQKARTSRERLLRAFENGRESRPVARHPTPMPSTNEPLVGSAADDDVVSH